MKQAESLKQAYIFFFIYSTFFFAFIILHVSQKSYLKLMRSRAHRIVQLLRGKKHTSRNL